MAQKALITCTLSGKNSTSILQNINVSKVKQVYIPDNTKIPPFNISVFHISTAKRKLIQKDLLDGNVSLIHDGPKIAFPCIIDTTLDLEGTLYTCTPSSLDWFSPPSRVITWPLAMRF